MKYVTIEDTDYVYDDGYCWTEHNTRYFLTDELPDLTDPKNYAGHLSYEEAKRIFSDWKSKPTDYITLKTYDNGKYQAWLQSYCTTLKPESIQDAYDKYSLCDAIYELYPNIMQDIQE